MATQYDIFNASGIKIRELTLSQNAAGDFVLAIVNTKLNVARVGEDGSKTLSTKPVGLQSAGTKLVFLDAPIKPKTTGFDFDLRFSLHAEIDSSFNLTAQGDSMDMRIGGDDYRMGRVVAPLQNGINVELELGTDNNKGSSFLRITGNF